MKRCSSSPSMIGKPEGLQLLWHRMVHDGGVNEWGVIQGPARVIWHECLALTTSYTVEDCEDWLAMLVEDGLLFEYEFEGCLYYATVNHERHAWRNQRACPTLPMSQEVADTRDFRKLANDKRESSKGGPSRGEVVRERVLEWATRCGVTVSLDSEPSVPVSRIRRDNAAVPPRIRGEHATNSPPTRRASESRSVVKCSEERCREEERDSTDVVRVLPETDTEPEPSEPLSNHSEAPNTSPQPPSQPMKWPKEALDALHEGGCHDMTKALRRIDVCQAEAAGGSKEVCLLAFALEARDRAAVENRTAERILALKLGSRPPDRPSPEYVTEARQLLGLEAKPEPRARQPDKPTRRDEVVVCGACGHPQVTDTDDPGSCIQCGESLRTEASE